MLILWDEEKFSVHVPEIDVQHKKWVKMINRLHAALMGQADSITVKRLMGEILDYCKYHFSMEEAFMEKMGFSGLEDHQKKHADFNKKMKAMERDLLSGALPLRTQVMSIMKNWLEDHIVKQDQAYRIFMEKKTEKITY